MERVAVEKFISGYARDVHVSMLRILELFMGTEIESSRV
jgi:hypothetical protein